MKTTTRRDRIEPPKSGLLCGRANRFTSPSISGNRSLVTFAAMMFTLLAGVNLASGEKMDEHIAALRKKIPSQAFSLVKWEPFVVIGDEPAELCDQNSAGSSPRRVICQSLTTGCQDLPPSSEKSMAYLTSALGGLLDWM